MKNEAADAPITFEEIVMVMINYCYTATASHNWAGRLTLFPKWPFHVTSH